MFSSTSPKVAWRLELHQQALVLEEESSQLSEEASSELRFQASATEEHKPPAAVLILVVGELVMLEEVATLELPEVEESEQAEESMLEELAVLELPKSFEHQDAPDCLLPTR